MQPQPTHLRPAFAPIALLLALTVGCVSPLDSEHHAYERWQQADERARYSRHLAADDEQTDDGNTSALPADPTLDDYLAYAEANQPTLAAAFHEWRAALSRVPQARALTDPTVSYRRFLQRGGDRQAVGLSQAFPWYGTLRARGDVAMADALAAEQRFEQQRRDVAEAVRQAYGDYLLLGRSLAVLAENIRILEEAANIAETRFEAGDTPSADVFRVHVAVERARDELASLEAQRGPLVAQLNAAIGRSAQHDLPLPGALPARTLDVNEADLLAQLSTSNPELQALAYETAGRRHGIRLAQQNRIPDFTLGVDYTDALEGTDPLSVVANVSVPLWFERTQAERSEALAAFGSVTHQLVQRRHELEAELRLAHARYRDADRRATLYEQTLIPMAREAFQAAEASYAEGESEFEAVAQAQLALQESQLTYARIAVDRFQRLSEIERLVGRRVDVNDAESPPTP